MNAKLNLYLVFSLMVFNACNQQAKKTKIDHVSINIANQNINFKDQLTN